MAERTISVELGPRIPLVPVMQFSTLRMAGEQWEDAWRLVGPSVQRNMARGVPLWRIIAAAYLEGIQHGAAANREAGGGDA